MNIYTIGGDTVVKSMVIAENDDYYTVVPINAPFKIKKESSFKNKKDAQYTLFCKKVQAGTPVQNYKSSPYYKYYMERAHDENPELLI